MTGFTVRGLMEYLFARRAPNLPPQGLADLVDRLLWCLDRNGSAEVQAVRTEWLQSGNLDKLRIALTISALLMLRIFVRSLSLSCSFCGLVTRPGGE